MLASSLWLLLFELLRENLSFCSSYLHIIIVFEIAFDNYIKFGFKMLSPKLFRILVNLDTSDTWILQYFNMGARVSSFGIRESPK